MARASAILNVSATALSIVDNVFASLGFTLNYSAGKSELLICFNGEGSGALQKRVFSQPQLALAFMGAANVVSRG
jgi:hypothetical protein